MSMRMATVTLLPECPCLLPSSLCPLPFGVGTVQQTLLHLGPMVALIESLFGVYEIFVNPHRTRPLWEYGVSHCLAPLLCSCAIFIMIS